MPTVNAPPQLYCHPATAIMLWLFFMVGLTRASTHELAGEAILLSVMLLHRGLPSWWRYVRRSRWLLLIMGVTQMWSASSSGIQIGWGLSLPSVLGIWSAVDLWGRWLLMLAALALLMSHLSRERLLSGILALLLPLHWLGVDTQSIAVRLGLTLHYAEQMLQEQTSFTQRIQQLHHLPVVGADTVQPLLLPHDEWRWCDALCVATFFVVQWGMQFLVRLNFSFFTHY